MCILILIVQNYLYLKREKLDDLLIHWVLVVTMVHDDIDAFIQEGVKNSN